MAGALGHRGTAGYKRKHQQRQHRNRVRISLHYPFSACPSHFRLADFRNGGGSKLFQHVGFMSIQAGTIRKERNMIELSLDTAHSILYRGQGLRSRKMISCSSRGRSIHTLKKGKPRRPHHRGPGLPRLGQSRGTGDALPLRARSSQAHQEDRPRDRLRRGQCRTAPGVTLCFRRDQAFFCRGDRGRETMGHDRALKRLPLRSTRHLAWIGTAAQFRYFCVAVPSPGADQRTFLFQY